MIRAIAALLCLGTCAPAYAEQPICGPRDVQAAFLSDQFGEAPVAMGLSEQGLVEMWGNPETGTWTVTITKPDGTMCGVLAGLLFEVKPVAPDGEPA